MNTFLLKPIFKRTTLVFILLFGSINAFSDHNRGFYEPSANEFVLSKQAVAALVRVDPQATQRDVDRQYKKLSEFLARLTEKKKKYQSEKRFLSHLFYKVHRKLLKQYRPHATFYQTLEKGSYDCVTGTATYALLLDALAIPYQVHEFPYHVYLSVTTTEGDTFLIESTDPQGGWVTDQDEQTRRADFYNLQSEEQSQKHFRYNFIINETITLTQLVGLSYFNEAVESYNQRNLRRAIDLLRHADRLYASPRIDSFKTLIASVAQDNS